MGLSSFVDIIIFGYGILFYFVSSYPPIILNLLHQNLQKFKDPKKEAWEFR